MIFGRTLILLCYTSAIISQWMLHWIHVRCLVPESRMLAVPSVSPRNNLPNSLFSSQLSRCVRWILKSHKCLVSCFLSSRIRHVMAISLFIFCASSDNICRASSYPSMKYDNRILISVVNCHCFSSCIIYRNRNVRRWNLHVNYFVSNFN